MKIRIVCDSSANLYTLDGVDFTPVPMKVIAGEKEYIDNEQLDVSKMLAELGEYKGKSGSSCPNINEWLEAFGDAEWVLGAALTSKISGAYSAASAAAQEYMNTYPERKVFILDSLTTGPELELIVEKYAELVKEKLDFDKICEEIQEYLRHTHLMFSLESLQNFVNNGRVKPAVASAAKLFGICIVGRASDQGELEPLNKCRGRERAYKQIFRLMSEAGFSGGKVRIRHSENPESAAALSEEIRASFPEYDIKIGKNNGLCSFYAEKGGLLVGFES